MLLAVFLVHVSLTAGIVKAGGGGVYVDPLLSSVSTVPLECGGHHCHPDQVCRHRIYHEELRSYCTSLLEAQKHHAVPCTQLPTGHEQCYCTDAACNMNIYNLIYQQNHVNQHVPLVCGGNTCHAYEKCHINVTSNRRIYFRCTKHEQRHCLPNLLTHGGCVCDTRACVEQNLISIVAGHQVSGLICDDHDDHVCQPNDVCTIVHENNGHIKKHCVHPSHLVGIECTALPALHHQCYCTTQECIYGQFTAHVTTTIQTSATSSSTFAPIVTAAPSGTTEAVLQSTIKPIQQNTEASTQQNTMEPTQTTSTTATCTDIEDGTFSCADYANQFNLCSATLAAQPTLYNIANKRCRHFCGICNQTIRFIRTGTGGSTGTGSGNTMIYQFTCMDHDTRCSLFSAQICSPTVSHDYVVSTCAKTCNLCPEYLASLKGLTTPPTTHQSTTESTQQSTVTPIYTTTPHSGPCLDKPGVDCNILNTTNICANILAARKYCAAYCGLC